jgi:hypothetical protein
MSYGANNFFITRIDSNLQLYNLNEVNSYHIQPKTQISVTELIDIAYIHYINPALRLFSLSIK